MSLLQSVYFHMYCTFSKAQNLKDEIEKPAQKQPDTLHKVVG